MFFFLVCFGLKSLGESEIKTHKSASKVLRAAALTGVLKFYSGFECEKTMIHILESYFHI